MTRWPFVWPSRTVLFNLNIKGWMERGCKMTDFASMMGRSSNLAVAKNNFTFFQWFWWCWGFQNAANKHKQNHADGFHYLRRFLDWWRGANVNNSNINSGTQNKNILFHWWWCWDEINRIIDDMLADSLRLSEFMMFSEVAVQWLEYPSQLIQVQFSARRDSVSQATINQHTAPLREFQHHCFHWWKSWQIFEDSLKDILSSILFVHKLGNSFNFCRHFSMTLVHLIHTWFYCLL